MPEWLYSAAALDYAHEPLDAPAGYVWEGGAESDPLAGLSDLGSAGDGPALPDAGGDAAFDFDFDFFPD